MLKVIKKPISFEVFADEPKEIIEQAKEMEKENLESLKDFDTWKEWKNKSE